MINLPKRRLYSLIPVLILVLIAGLWHHKVHKTQHAGTVVQVRSKTIRTSLNFTGSIQPLRETSVTSPMSAVVESMFCHYGQKVSKGQVLFTLNSAELQREYHDTLTDYLKAKDSYDISMHKFTGTEELWKAGLLSKNNYLSERSTLNTVRVTLMQATRKLSEILEKLDNSDYDELSSLSFSEFDKVRLALANKHNLINIKAQRAGILLTPPKGHGEAIEHLGVGSAVKADQVLGLIGDMQGIRIDISIPEVEIAQVALGVPATVKSLALPQHPMQGQVVAINAQASTGTSSALPSFTATVEVPHLDEALQGIIKVGMSATIVLKLQQVDKLLVPLEAITQAAGGSYVTLLDHTGILHQTKVNTGAIHGNDVIIESGLHVGEQVMYAAH